MHRVYGSVICSATVRVRASMSTSRTFEVDAVADSRRRSSVAASTAAALATAVDGEGADVPPKRNRCTGSVDLVRVDGVRGRLYTIRLSHDKFTTESHTHTHTHHTISITSFYRVQYVYVLIIGACLENDHRICRSAVTICADVLCVCSTFADL